MMLTRRTFLHSGIAMAALATSGCSKAAKSGFEFQLSDAEWRKKLGPAAYAVMRQEDTERPNSSPLNKEKRVGTYHCKGCNLPLYPSRTKYESGTGWPSFWAPLPNAIRTKKDPGWLGPRIECHCRRCGSHMGHVFDDGPKPTGKRYCMNGIAMVFVPG